MQQRFIDGYEKQKNVNLHLNLLLNSMDIALWDMIVDPKDPVAGDNEFWWSDEFRKMLGFNDQQDLPNVLSSWSERLHPEDKERTLNAFAAHITDKTGRTPYSLKYRLKRKDGEYRTFNAFGDTSRDVAGNPLRVAGAIEDITEREGMQEQLDDERKQLENKNLRLDLLMKSGGVLKSRVAILFHISSKKWTSR